MKYLRAIVSWPIVVWTCYIFLASLPYKFTGHPETQHIFGTIGQWLGGFLGESAGTLFTQYGAYVIGGFERLVLFLINQGWSDEERYSQV